jgi:hypothetical protein
MTTTPVQIPGYVVGAWDIDPMHSTVGFSVRHMMVSKIRGYIREFSGEIVTALAPRLDGHRVHRRCLDRHPAGAARRAHPLGRLPRRRQPPADEGKHQAGDPDPGAQGFGPDAYGGTRAGFSARTEISRAEFGVDISMPMDGDVVVGDRVSVELEIEAVLRTPEPPAMKSGKSSLSAHGGDRPNHGETRNTCPCPHFSPVIASRP